MAPELLADRNPKTKESDVWSFGCLVLYVGILEDF